jgi:peptidoglycan/LPS O-acetylase OafA/YrhL
LNTIGGLSELAFATCFFIVLNRWVRAEEHGKFTQRWAHTLTTIGVFSYSLYLVHHPTIAVLETWMPLGPRSSPAATLMRVMLYVPICIGIAYVFFAAIERHFLTHRKGQWISWVRGMALIRWCSATAPSIRFSDRRL